MNLRISSIAAVFLIQCALSVIVQAQTITPATGGGSISIDNFSSGTWTTLTGPSLQETSPGQLTAGNFRLKVPSGFEFDTGGTAPTVSVTSPKSQKITVTFSSRSSTEIVFSITGSSGGTPPNNPHLVTFSNIRVRPDQGTPLPSGNITNVGSAAPGGTTSYGALSTVVGADAQIRVEDAANSSGSLISAQSIEAGESLTLYANVRDQYGNFIRNETANWSTESETGGVTDSDLSTSSGTTSTFTATLTGTALIQADLATDLDSVLTGTITVTPSDATTLSIATQPVASDTAGQAFDTQPIIHILDDYSNIVTTDNFTEITAAINTGSGSLNGDVDITASGGVATFTDLSYTIAENIDIDFSAAGFTTVTSNIVTVVPDTAYGLSFLVQPTNGNRNTALSPAIEVQIVDEYDNPVSQSGTTIDLSINSGSGNISGESEVTDANGTATYNSLSFNQTGSKTIIASSIGLQNSAVSNSFTIATAGSLAGFEIDTTGGGAIGTLQAGDTIDLRIRAVDGVGALLDGNMGRDNFSGFVDLTTTSTFSGTTTTTSIGPFVDGVFDPHSVVLTESGNSVTITATNSSGTEAGSSDSFQVLPSSPSVDSSFVSFSETTLIADGASTSIITANLKDEFGNSLIDNTSSSITISITSNGGSLTGSISGNNDGTYTDTLTAASSVGADTISVFIDGTKIENLNSDSTATYTFGELSTFEIVEVGEVDIPTQTAGTSFSLKITALDAYENIIESFNGATNTVEITSTGTISSGSGTTTTFTNGVLSSHAVTITSAGSTTITARKTASSETGTSNSFIVNPADADATNTTITAGQPFLQNDGSDNTTITVQLVDAYGNNLTTNPGTINMDKNGASASLSATATYAGNGSYTATITASTTTETVTINADLNGSTIFTDNATVVVSQFNEWEGDAGGNPSNKIDWGNTSNWSLNSIPSTGQVVVIPTGLSYYPVIDGEDPTLDFLEIESGANVNLSSRDITINNAITGNGSFFGNSSNVYLAGNSTVANFISGSSNVYLNGSSLQTIDNDFTADSLFIQNDVEANDYFEAFSSIEIEASNTLTMNSGSQLVALGNLNIEGDLIGTSSSFSISGDLNVGGSASITTTNTDFTLNGTSEQTINGIETIKSFTIDNSAGVVVNNDIEVTDTLFLTSGTITIESGYSIVSNVKQGNTSNIIARRLISGDEGWRMLSSPLDSDYDDLLDSTITQGFTGSTLGNAALDSLQPNVLYYDETYAGTDNQRWRAPASAATSVTAGQGMFVFFFDDQSGTDARYDNPLPDTLDVQGAEFDGDGTEFTFPVTYTVSADTGWNLVGNPFLATIDWDDGNWTKTNMDNTFYVWSDTANSGNGDYLTWNGITGSMGDGLIAPFQGFWVKANGNGTPVLKVNKASKTVSGTFYKQTRGEPSFELILNERGLSKSTHFSFTEHGKFGKDNFDAYNLTPFRTGTYLEIFTLNNDGSQFVINNLPRDFGIPIDIPIYINGYQNFQPINTEFELTWKNLKEVPESWEIELLDKDKNKINSLREAENFKFTPSVKSKELVKPKTILDFFDGKLTTKNKQLLSDSEFYIRIIPGQDGSDFPKEFKLHQNYPNPFNPTTKITFELPIQSSVQLVIFDILGREIAQPVSEVLNAGIHTIEFEGNSLASGVYFYTLRTSTKVITRRMMLIK